MVDVVVVVAEPTLRTGAAAMVDGGTRVSGVDTDPLSTVDWDAETAVVVVAVGLLMMIWSTGAAVVVVDGTVVVVVVVVVEVVVVVGTGVHIA